MLSQGTPSPALKVASAWIHTWIAMCSAVALALCQGVRGPHQYPTCPTCRQQPPPSLVSVLHPGSHLLQASPETQLPVPERVDPHGPRVRGDEEPTSRNW